MTHTSIVAVFVVAAAAVIAVTLITSDPGAATRPAGSSGRDQAAIHGVVDKDGQAAAGNLGKQ
jgi:hypothetical protein